MTTLEHSNPEAMTPEERSVFFNAHRYRTPGHEGWEHVATPGAPNKFLMISADCHVNEPPNLWVERIDEQYRHRLPRIEVDANGVKWSIVEGYHPVKLRDLKMEGEDAGAGEGGQERSGGAAPGPRPRRHRRGDHLPEPWTPDVGDAGSVVRAGDVPGLQRLVLGDFRAALRPHAPYGLHRDRGHPVGCRGDRTMCKARLPRAEPALQADVGSRLIGGLELQPAGVRPAVGVHPGARICRSLFTCRRGRTRALPEGMAEL